MDELIARMNISRFRAQLEISSDEVQKATLRKLLNGEEQHLSAILNEIAEANGRDDESADMNGHTVRARDGLKF
jgi:hypothetical protein